MAFHSKTHWHAIARETADSGERWSVIWDTTRRERSEGRNTAVEKFEAAALDRARHLLRMGFVVYEIRAPQGSVFLEEAEIKARLGLSVEDGEAAPVREPDTAV
jgi:hypothetical protein